MTIGQRIKTQRLKLGMTQKQLGTLCGMADSAIRKYESGKITPKFETLSKIASALSVNTFDLMDKVTIDAYERGIENSFKMHEALNAVASDIWKSYGYTGSEEESQLIYAFSRLNSDGQKKAIERIQELLEVPKYQNNNPPCKLEVLSFEDMEDIPY